MQQAQRTYAHCAPNGRIEFSQTPPEWHEILAVGEAPLVRRRIQATSRQDAHGHYYVPGMQEAHDHGLIRERFAALARYIVQLDAYSGAGFRAVHA